jgi:hypothetical protein
VKIPVAVYIACAIVTGALIVFVARIFIALGSS